MERQALSKEKSGASPSVGSHAARASHPSTHAHQLLSLQRTLGNRAVHRLLQAKLRVSQPDDEYEQEADRVAEQVMRMPEPAPAHTPVSGAAQTARLQRAPGVEEEEEEETEALNRKPAVGVAQDGRVARPDIQRVCSGCEEELQRQAEEVEEEEEEEEEVELQLQAQGAAGQADKAPSEVENYVHGLSHKGQPLPASVRGFFEPRFGFDFSRVRVHTDAGAAASAKSVGALAYTVGPDVVFGAGQYAPESQGGQRLLAHELTHVVQQGYAHPSTAPANETAAAQGERVATAAAPPRAASRVAEAAVQRQAVIDPTIYTLTQDEADAMSVEDLERHITDVRAALERTSIIDTTYDTLEANLIILEAALKKKTPPDPYEPDDFEWEEEEEEQGKEIQQAGIVNFDGYDKKAQKAGPVTDVALRQLPSTSSTVVKRLPVNTRLFVDRELLGDWYYVVLEDGTEGYVMKGLVSTEMPDPEARLHRIKSGESALDIVRQYYKGDAIEWGQDARFYVNVLVLVNQAAGRKWIYKPSEGASWDETKTIAGGQIWIPGREFAKSLSGVVSSGSISYEVWSTVRDFAIGVVGFIAGLLHGALESIVDVFVGLYDLVKMVYDIIKSLVTGEIISDIQKLWNDVNGLSFDAIKEAVSGWLDNNWNNPSTWKRWHFRGWIIGYAIAEIAMFFFTGGAATAAKWLGKGAKVAKLIAEFPTIVKLGKAAKALTGPAADTARAAVKGVKALSAAHAWARKVLGIPYKFLVNMTEEAAESLRRLPNWARERFADLNHEVMRRLLGCASPCQVDVLQIEKYLKEMTPAAKLAAKTLSTEADIIAALPKGMKTSTILKKLQTRPALLKAITEAKLTDADFVKLADFLSDADKASPAAAYRTFVRYVTNVVPAKVEGDVSKFNKIAAELIKADPRQGAALKGSMFEQFSKLNVPELGGKNFQRVRFVSSKLQKKSRTADNFVPEKGEIWEIKHSYSAVPPDQAVDYTAIIGMKTPAGDVVKSINYLFPDEAAAKASRYLKDTYGFRVTYIHPTTKALVDL